MNTKVIPTKKENLPKHFQNSNNMVVTKLPGYTKIFILLFTSLQVFNLPARAQFRKAKLIKPVLSLNYEKQPAAGFSDTSGHFGFDKVSLAFQLPLFTRMQKGTKAGSFGYTGLLLNTGGSCSFPNFSFGSLNTQYLFFHMGLKGFFYGGRKTVYIAGINSFVAEDKNTLNKPLLRFNGSAMLIHRVSSAFSYIVGASYSFVYGSGYPFPILGARLNLGKRSKLNMVLPFSVTYRYLFGEHNDICLFLKPDGGISRISNSKNEFVGHPEILTMKQRAFQLGASVTLFAGSRFGITPLAGFHGKRSLKIADKESKSSDFFFNEKINTGFFFGLGLKYRFGMKTYHGENDAVNYLMENGIDSIPLDSNEN